MPEEHNQTGDLPTKDCFLFLSRGSGPSTGYPLFEEVTIGRSQDNSICLDDDSVSRNHARVSFQEGSWTVEDLGSTNGIIFKGERVEKLVLSSGDIFQIGNFIFRFTETDIPEARDQFFETITIL